MKEQKFSAGSKLITQGEIGSEYFILKKGECQVTITNPIDQQQTKSKIVQVGEGFGEVALLYDAVRTATITCTTDVEVWQLDGNIFKQIIIENSQ